MITLLGGRPTRHLLTCGIAVFIWTALPAQAQAPEADSVRTQFVGIYRLGAYAGHGDEPTGRISYDGAGRMWAMLFPPGREPLSNESSAEEYRANMQGVIAYYGTYEVHAADGRVIHHVEGASNPAWIGTEFERWYRFEDGNLTLSLNPSFNNPLLWERMSD